MVENFVPLSMGDKPIGRIAIDPETGDFTGRLDPALSEFITQGFADGLLQVSFLGVPSMPIPEFQKRMKNYLAGVEEPLLHLDITNPLRKVH